MEESKTDHVTPPTTPNKATPSPPRSNERPMCLSSPELLKELEQPHALKHVPPHTGLTKVFCGRGRQNQETESVKKPALRRQQSQ